MLIMDKRQHDALYRLSPHLTVFSLQVPEKIDSVTNLPGPDVSTFNYYLSDPAARRTLH